jgi:photosystem II stability/assembly factor-like uncharacterized protein
MSGASLPRSRAFGALQGTACACAALLAMTRALAAEPPDASDPVALPAWHAPLASRALMLDGARGGNIVVAVGERGIALTSRDDGRTWQQGEVPVRSTLTGIHMADDQLGWAVGHDSVILRTRDGGKTWQLVNYAPEEETPLLDVWFADASRGFAVGAYGKFLETSDGGEHWQARDFVAPPYGDSGRRTSAGRADAAVEEDDSDRGEIWQDTEEGPLDYHLNQIAVAPEGTLYIAAEAGHVFRSDDGGESWTTLPSPYDGSFFGVLPLGGERLLVVGLRGHMFRSDDGGLTWTETPSGTTATLTPGVRLEDGTVLVGGLAGTLLESRDDAATFTLRERADRLGISVLLAAEAGQVILIGEGGARRMAIADALGGEAASKGAGR